MKPTRIVHHCVPFMLALLLGGASAFSQTTAFTYQGSLQMDGVAAEGEYDMSFNLHYTASGGTPIASQQVTATQVDNGLFTVALNFGSAPFNGQDTWLEVAVRPTGVGVFQPLAPRQPLMPVPYALHAQTAGVVLAGSVFNPTFLGNTGNATLALQVASQPALRLEPDPDPYLGSLHSFNVLGGYTGNVAGTGVRGAAIGGGGTADSFGLEVFELPNVVDGNFGTIAGGLGNVAGFEAFVGGGMLNAAAAQGSVIGGGSSNLVASTSPQSVVAGGLGNTILAESEQATVGGGLLNLIEAAGHYNVIAGGALNQIGPTATDSVVSGGRVNVIQSDTFATVIAGGNNNTASADRSVISGGSDNYSFPEGDGTVIGGGIANTIGLASQNSVIAGGTGNLIGAGSDGTTIGGGSDNEVGQDIFQSTIAGGNDNLIIDGANEGAIGGGAANVIRGTASAAVIGGGFRNTNSGTYASVPGGLENYALGRASFAGGTRAKALHTGSFVWADNTGGNLLTSRTNQFIVRASGGVRFYSEPTLTIGVELLPGEGAFSSLSDRNLKDNFAPVDTEAVLDRVNELPIQTWNYRSGQEPIRHMGPMAQDFHEAFGVGHDERHIATVDADGVALAAIQGLHSRMRRELDTRDEEIRELRQSLADLQALVQRMRAASEESP